MSEVGKWEDLKFECLVNILTRVGIVSLLIDVPFVCKSWHKASLHHSCYKHIYFHQLTDNDRISTHSYSPCLLRFINEYRVDNFSIGGLIKLMVARGLGKSTRIWLPSVCCSMDLHLISKTCHDLTSLTIDLSCIDHESIVADLIGKWKLLEELCLFNVNEPILPELFYEIGENCSKFCKLTLVYGEVKEKDAMAFANYLPDITHLSLVGCNAERKILEMVVLGSESLEVLNLYKCELRGFSKDKKELHYLGPNVSVHYLDASLYLANLE